MGQRHQAYARIPARFYNEGNPNNYPAQTVGIHHQWCYGHTALRLAKNVLSFAKAEHERGSPYSPFATGGWTRYRDGWAGGEANAVLAVLYSVIPEDGYYHGVIDEGRAIVAEIRRAQAGGGRPLRGIESPIFTTPEHGDNNDGITVFDFEQRGANGLPRYAFSRIDHMDGDKGGFPGIIWKAGDYLRLYYPEHEWEGWMHQLVRFFDQFEPLVAADWGRIFPNWAWGPKAVQR